MFLESKKYHDDSYFTRQMIDGSGVCIYGIDFLDDKLKGIHPNELVLIGAKTGCGKTELVEHIASVNADRGRKVAFIRLEGDCTEFSERQRFKMICDMYYIDDNKPRVNGLDYASYRLNKTIGIKKYDEQANELLKRMHKNLILYDKKTIPSTDEVVMIIDHIASDVNLVILDHINYLDFMSCGSEYEGENRVMIELKRLTEFRGVPVIVVSHFGKNADKLIPDTSDFIGSSNKSKIANTVIVIAPDYENRNEINYQYSTFFRIAKSRAGVSSNIVASKVFDGKKKMYKSGYGVRVIQNNGKSVSDEVIERVN